jgi:hypothetical protein
LLALAGCGGGGSKTPAEAAANCLESHDFDAQPEGDTQVYGTSPTGITFTLTIGAKGFTINDFENPPATLGGEPQRLKPTERQIVRGCAAER